jgi:hypothetical protein
MLYPAELRAQSDSKVVVRAVVAMFVIATCAFVHSGTKKQSMNSLMVIAPYKWNGMWVFDDPAVGLDKEPFIAGIDTMIDKMTANIPDADRGFRAVFSAQPFPGYAEELEWRREESGGNWYYSPRYRIEGWLCPALFKYFPQAPRTIYVKPEPLTRRPAA